ncbi:MAG: hypothetical protein OEZ34_01305 [Spirochaetia bacterium]|nr:hypothetical protein [Spirochaetia bacterium]
MMIKFLNRYSILYTLPVLIALLTISSVMVGSFAGHVQMRRLVEQEALEAFREKIARSRENLGFLLRDGHTAGVNLYVASFSLSNYNVLSILVDDRGKIISSTEGEYFGEMDFAVLKKMQSPFSENDFHASGIQIKKVNGADHREYLHGMIDICGKDADFKGKNLKNCGYFYSMKKTTAGTLMRTGMISPRPDSENR